MAFMLWWVLSRGKPESSDFSWMAQNSQTLSDFKYRAREIVHLPCMQLTLLWYPTLTMVPPKVSGMVPKHSFPPPPPVPPFVFCNMDAGKPRTYSFELQAVEYSWAASIHLSPMWDTCLKLNLLTLGKSRAEKGPLLSGSIVPVSSQPWTFLSCENN